MHRRGILLLVLLATLNLTPAHGMVLPHSVQKALRRAKVPLNAVALLVVNADGLEAPKISHRIDKPMNPASVMKLVTTYAALDILGPDFTWKTRVVLDGQLRDNWLNGNLLVRGDGDPKMVVERLQALLSMVQSQGARGIHGDIVLDRSAFQLPALNPADFDAEPLRPYNAQPDALLINFKTLVITFTPDPLQGRALIRVEPTLAGFQADASVPLVLNRSCGDWRKELQGTLDRPDGLQFQGGYPWACGEKTWSIAYSEPATFAARSIEGTWRSLGGVLTGRVRDATPEELKLLRTTGTLSSHKAPVVFEVPSLPLIDIVHDINKFSNNVMAQQLFLTLGRYGAANPTQNGTPEAASAAIQAWWHKKLSRAAPPTVENGSGLSRIERISVASLAQLLSQAAHSKLASHLQDSLPIAGIDATMKERVQKIAGRAFIKTGSLRDVSAVAGYAYSHSGKRYVVVGIVNHNNASAARSALDAMIEWAVQER